MPHIDRFELRASAVCDKCIALQQMLDRVNPEMGQGKLWKDFVARLADAHALALQLQGQPAGRCTSATVAAETAAATAAATVAEIQLLMAGAIAAADYNRYIVTNVAVIKNLSDAEKHLLRALKCTSPVARRRTASPAVAPQLTTIPEGGGPQEA